jgi:hypothetical protein
VVLLRVYFRIRRLSARVIISALNAWFGQVQLLVSLRKTGLIYGVRSILREERLKASSIFFTETVNRSKLVPADANLNFEMEAKK